MCWRRPVVGRVPFCQPPLAARNATFFRDKFSSCCKTPPSITGPHPRPGAHSWWMNREVCSASCDTPARAGQRVQWLCLCDTSTRHCWWRWMGTRHWRRVKDWSDTWHVTDLSPSFNYFNHIRQTDRQTDDSGQLTDSRQPGHSCHWLPRDKAWNDNIVLIYDDDDNDDDMSYYANDTEIHFHCLWWQYLNSLTLSVVTIFKLSDIVCADNI